MVVDVLPLRLPVRDKKSSLVRPLVPIKAKPAEVVYYLLLELLFRSLPVGVFNSENERPARLLVEKGGPGVTDVKVPCRTWSEPHSYLTHSVSAQNRGQSLFYDSAALRP